MAVSPRRSPGILLCALLSGCLFAHAGDTQRLVIAFKAGVADPADAGYLDVLGERIGCPLTRLEGPATGPHVYLCEAPADTLDAILSRLRQDPDIEFAEADRLTAPAAR